MKKQRIWELDALRGVCLLGMVLVHLLYDLIVFTDITFYPPVWFYTVQKYGHLLFILLSGICVTLGSKCVKRGLTVFAAGMIVTLVTTIMDYGFDVSNVRIWFGILHLLGFSMLVFPLFRPLPPWLLALIGIAVIAVGYWFTTFSVGVDFLFPLGLRSGKFFTGADYFPIFPSFGTFLLGAALGKLFYVKKRTMFPNVSTNSSAIRFFSFVGRHSLIIYLVHQPILFSFVTLLF